MTPEIRVLLADDHAVVRKGIREFLEESGDIEVIAEADNGAEALRLIEEYPPDVAVPLAHVPGLRSPAAPVARVPSVVSRSAGAAYFPRRSHPAGDGRDSSVRTCA